MYKIILIILFQISSLFISAQLSENKNAIKIVLTNQEVAWNNGNITGYMQGYWNNDSLKFISKKGISYGWETTLKHYEKSYPDKLTMGILEFELLNMDIYAVEMAYVIGNWKLKRKIGDIGGVFTLLLKKINGEWKIICDHTE